MSNVDELLTAEELATRLKIQPTTVRGWARAGKIPSRKLSHKVIRFNLPKVVAALEAAERKAVVQ